MKKGFTLVELLVVVLIIGIIAAMAMPHYEKAVWQSRNAQLKSAVRTIAEAQKIHYMKTGRLAASFNALSVNIPLKVKQTNAGTNSNDCLITVRKGEGVLEGKNFIVVLGSASATQGTSIAVWTEGKYKCNGFRFSVLEDDFKCVEGRVGANTIKQGEFCEALESATFAKHYGSWDQYSLP